MPAESTYSIEAVRELDTHRTPIQKQSEMLLYGSIQFDSCPKSYKGEDWKPPACPHEVPLLTLTANRVIEMDDPAAATDSSGIPSTIERSPLDFAYEAGASDQGTVAPEMSPSENVPATDAPGESQVEEVAAADPPVATESRKRGSAYEGKSLAAIQLGLASSHPVPVPENAPAGGSDPDPLSFAGPQSRHPADIAQSSQGTAAAGDPDSKNASSPLAVGSPKSIYRPEWGVVNGSLLDTPEACQDLAIQRQLSPAGGNGVTATLEIRTGGKAAEEIRCSGGSPGQKDSSPGARNKKLEALLEAETNTKKVAEDKSDGLSQELEDMRARFSDLQVSNERLSQQVATLQQQVSGEEKLKATFEEFKRHQDDRVEQRCTEIEAQTDTFLLHL
nr:hypothetical protein [Tanacetum cinerariifolium]